MSNYKFTEKQEAWLQKLESDEMQDKQCVRTLQDHQGKMCCLGVFCLMQPDIVNENNRFRWLNIQLSEVLNEEMYTRLGLRDECGTFKKDLEINGVEISCLTNLNDRMGWTFKQIAAYIRANPENVFVKGAE